MLLPRYYGGEGRCNENVRGSEAKACCEQTRNNPSFFINASSERGVEREGSFSLTFQGHGGYEQAVRTPPEGSNRSACCGTRAKRLFIEGKIVEMASLLEA